MKNKLKIISLTIVNTILFSCSHNFEKINTDPINLLSTAPEKLLAPALKNVMTANLIRNRNFNNELMQVTVDMSDVEGKVFRYEVRNNWSDYTWNIWYVQLTALKEMYALASEKGKEKTAYQGISLICQTWVYSLITDTYGDCPYFQSNQGREGINQPAFDKQKDIYLDMFKKLEEANSLLATSENVNAINDPIFLGNVSKWRKFGNSLYLRLLLRISGKSEVATYCITKIKEVVDNPTTYPIMADNDDNAVFKWTGTQDTNHPYSSPLLTVREQEFRAPAICTFFIENIRNWNHPVLLSAYMINGVNRWGIAQAPTGGYDGIPSGYIPGAGKTRQSYFYSYAQTVSNVQVGDKSLQQSASTGILMNYAELQFILAEAVAKGWISGNAETYYNEGVYATIAYWIPTYAKTATATYMANADIEYIPFDLNDALQKIHLQKYYALFLVDMQQWFEYRRTGYPILPKGTGLKNNGIMPARMVYPVYVQSANPSNYSFAIQQQGPDLISTNVWWQKP